MSVDPSVQLLRYHGVSKEGGMDSNDVIGTTFVLIVILAVIFGIKSMARPSNMTSEEYEQSVREGSGVASSAMNALHEAFHPRVAESVAVQKDMRAGYYNDQEKAEGDPNETGLPIDERS